MAVPSLMCLVLDFITTEIRDFNEQCYYRTTKGEEKMFCRACDKFRKAPQCIYCPITLKRKMIHLWFEWLNEAGSNVKLDFFKMLARKENAVCRVIFHIHPRRCTRFCSKCFSTYRLLRE